MRQVFAKKNYVLLHDDGRINFPFSKFLTDRFTNPHTRELVAQALRVFYRFSAAHQIELALRAVEGRGLTYDETKKLSELCYRPLPEVEEMAGTRIVALTSAKAGKAPKELPGAVEPNTARKRLNHIAGFLDFYREVFIDPHIRSATIREKLKNEYEKIGHQLRGAVRGTKQTHHLAIKSLPTDKYLSIIEAVFTRPHDLFQTAAGKPSRTLLRDRAMVQAGQNTVITSPQPQLRIGIVAGHNGNDSGAVCYDENGEVDLKEADVNFEIATLVQKSLEAQGYQVDLLNEFDTRLNGYRAVALVSIHNDSCEYGNDEATGFKVASSLETRDVNRAQRLNACLVDRYERITGMIFHANSITGDMREYHAFSEIDPNTITAIIETGFLNLDNDSACSENR